MEKLKELPIKVELGLLEEELKALIENESYQISAQRQDSDGDWISIEVFKTKKK